jgi:altered-inheritance-of-mitochondria protein 13
MTRREIRTDFLEFAETNIREKTDSTRAQDLELQKHVRVTEKLTEKRDAQSKRLTDLTESLTTKAPVPDQEEQPAKSGFFSSLKSPFYRDHSSNSDDKKMDSGRSNESVNKEVAALRAKLDNRKKLEQLPPSVEKAKEELVSCLRTNDRRPLDCWQEVEKFKTEVGKLEKAFIEKAAR